MGFEVVLAESLHEWEIFDGAVFHEEENIFVAGGLVRELSKDSIGDFAGEAEVGDGFFASFVGGEAVEWVFLSDDIVPVDVEARGGSGGVIGYGVEVAFASRKADAAGFEIVAGVVHVAIKTVGVG